MNCSSSERRFEAFLDGALRPAERAALIAHLEGCGRCRLVLDELRALEALLASPRPVALPENFTFATMAEVRALPAPRRASPPLGAFAVSYLVTAWLLVAAAAWLVPGAVHLALGLCVDLARAVSGVAGDLAAALAHGIGRGTPLPALVAGALVLDAALAAAVVAGVALLRPHVAERLRS